MSASCPLYPRKRHQRAQWIFLCFPTHHKNTEAFGFSLRNLGLQFRIVLLIKPEQGNRLVRYASGTRRIICAIRKCYRGSYPSMRLSNSSSSEARRCVSRVTSVEALSCVNRLTSVSKRSRSLMTSRYSRHSALKLASLPTNSRTAASSSENCVD